MAVMVNTEPQYEELHYTYVYGPWNSWKRWKYVNANPMTTNAMLYFQSTYNLHEWISHKYSWLAQL
jgi:hypothetical protein